MHSDSLRPAISIDLKRHRIRIYKRTIHALGNPQYILLLINPEDCTIIILRSDNSDRRAVRLPQARFEDKQCFELHSKGLIQNLRSMCENWTEDYSYRMYGDVNRTEEMVQFCISEASPICGVRGQQYAGT